jgi:NAD(P)-dependent dehydrogenase (short-subunit alcohol dehydrogenase family)
VPAIELKGKVALVTGSARRVGKAIALELARQGVNLIVHHSASDSEAEETASAARALNTDAIVAKADLRQPADIRRLFETIRQHFGRLDLLVNSASSFKTGSILELSLEAWREVLDVNLTALMRETGAGGAIINIVDLSGFRPWKSHPQHSVAKAGLVALTEVLALSLGPDIRVNAIAPGPVLRDEGNSPEQWQRLGQSIPLGRTGDPLDVAQAVVFLASQPFITGATLRVDGGKFLI